MTKLKNFLRCYAMGMGIKSIANTFQISRNTVRKYVRRYQESGLSLEQLQSMSEDKLQDMFLDNRNRCRQPSSRMEELEALVPDYVKRLSQKGVTVKSLHEEYLSERPGGYRYSNFKRAIRRYKYQLKAVGHVEHLAGDQMYIDYAGDKLEIVDAETGEVQGVEVFVAVLPCSHYTYCEAVRSQKKEDLIAACENALHFFGGSPMAVVPDNLKAAVTRSDRNDPVINEDFASWAEHYDMSVFPARVRHPKDKALVENAVKLMYRSVYTDVEGLIFHDLNSLNAAIRTSLDRFNSRRMSGREESRRELFEGLEKDYLQPLPSVRYQMKSRKTATVMRNSYVMLEKHHYSVPVEYIGKRVDIIYDADTLEIYHGLKLVTVHHRDDRPYGYTQKASHNLPGRQGSYEKDLEEIYERAASIDNILLAYLKEVTARKKYLPQAFRICRGILSLERNYGLDRLVAACVCASEGNLYGYNEIKDVLERGDDVSFMASEYESMNRECKHDRTRTYVERNTTQTNHITQGRKTMNTDNRTAPAVQEKERNQVSIDLMRRMRLNGMAAAFAESLSSTYAETMPPDGFVSWLLAREWDYRSSAAIERLIRGANFRYKAYPEEIDYAINRGLERNQMERLLALDFVRQGMNLFITGSSGTGKSFLATTIGYQACKNGIRTLYANTTKLLGILKVAKVKGTLENELKKIERCQLLILDDAFLVPLDAKERSILLDIIEDRHGRKSIVVSSQLPVSSWYDAIGEPTVADAVLDRIVHSAHRIELTGESLRKINAKKK